jgi:predicted TIM-barrel fold metal-dependent hydrolase
MSAISYIDFRIRPLDESPSVDLSGSDAEGYTRVYGQGFTEDRSLDTLVRDMADLGVVGVMQAEWEEDDPRLVNERVAAALARHPDRLVAGMATTDPRRPDALEILKSAHDDLGLKGWNVQPGFLKVALMDERCLPLLEYCATDGHPVAVHTGINFSETGPISLGHPSQVCEAACAFPGLTLICSHGGWPWVTEMLAVLWKHPTVYADFGAIAPKRMVGPKGGWEPVAHWMNSMVSDQVLLATDWPMMRHSRLAEELPLLGLSEESLDRYTRLNAARLVDKFWGTHLEETIQGVPQGAVGP